MDAAPAMSFMEITAQEVSYVDLTCGEHQVSIRAVSENWLEVDGEPFICFNMSSRKFITFIYKCIGFGGKQSDHSRETFLGLHKLKELRNKHIPDSESKPAMFDTPPKVVPRKKAAAQWPETITVDIELDGWPVIKVLSRNTRDNEYLWVHTDDLGIVISYIKLNGIDDDLKRARHALPTGIQLRKKIKNGISTSVFVVATQNGEGKEYRQFESIVDALDFQQNQNA